MDAGLSINSVVEGHFTGRQHARDRVNTLVGVFSDKELPLEFIARDMKKDRTSVVVDAFWVGWLKNKAELSPSLANPTV